jgi:hypothetical protein
MRSTILWAAYLLIGLSVGYQESYTFAQERSWKGKLTIVTFNFSEATEHNNVLKTDRVLQNATMEWYGYDLYQSAQRIVREELTYISRNRSVELPMDVKILDYGRNTEVTFDKGGTQEARWRLMPPTHPTPLETRGILGQTCQGLQYEWKKDGYTLRRQLWLAKDTNFKTPLFQMRYLFKPAGTMIYMETRVVTEFEPVPDLPASLFEAPQGLKVVDMPDVD